MPTSKEFLREFLALTEGMPVGLRPMMGEYIIYYRDRVLGGLYDNRLLVKPVAAADPFLQEGRLELPYEGAKPMLRLDLTRGRRYLEELFEAMYPELPEKKQKNRDAGQR